MTDQWDEKALKIAWDFTSVDYPIGCRRARANAIAAALRAAYDRGVEDSAGVADSWMADESGPNYGMMPDEARRELRGENRLAFKIAAAIRALKGSTS